MPCMACKNDLAIGEAQGEITETQQDFTKICDKEVATVGDKVQVTGKDGPDVGEIIDGCDYIKVDDKVVAIDGSNWQSPKYRGTIRVINRCCVKCCEGGSFSFGLPSFSFQSPGGIPGGPNSPDLTTDQIREISNDTGVPFEKVKEIVNRPTEVEQCEPADGLRSSKKCETDENTSNGISRSDNGCEEPDINGLS